MIHGLPQKLRRAKRARYARMGQQIRMRRLTERVSERLLKERVTRLLSQATLRIDLLSQAFLRANEEANRLIAGGKRSDD